MKKIDVVFGVVMFVVLLHAAAAQTSQSAMNLSYHVTDQKTTINGAVGFAEPFSGNITLTIPLDAVALAVYANDRIQPMKLEEQSLSLSLVQTKSLRWGYVSKSFLDKNSFIANIIFPIAVKSATVKVTLPEKAVLTKPVTQTSGSVFPRPTALTTDGQTITVIWQKNDVKAAEDFPIYVTYDMQSIVPWYFYVAIAVLALFFLGIATYYVHRAKIRRQHQHAQQRSTHSVEQERANPEEKGQAIQTATIETHLKEDEQQVLSILKQREGQAEQGTLRVITGFSKAKLSGLLKELEERKVVFREKRGKKNLVFLKEL